MAPAAEQTSPQGLRRLEREYSLAAELDSAWAAKPLALTRHEGRTILILEDPGGEPLDWIFQRDPGKPLDLTRFLHIAIGLTKALGQVHRRGLIHKDIKPANVLVDDAGNVWLTGFGIASQLSHERQPPAPPEIIVGTLAYMAPEQTGRMNRSVDSRSDLYSLGVTLYEMLTGNLPFDAADAMEWVHCHIARKPALPESTEFPAALSAVILRLLAKTAEERYQTAGGLEADLQRCLTEWEGQGHIKPFSLGTTDVPNRLLIPEKLYGREREVNTLITAFDRVVAHGTPELVLISGYSGIGKSSVLNELHKALLPLRGFFASGKFDQYKRDIPYATMAQAFQTLVRQILLKSEAEVQLYWDSRSDLTFSLWRERAECELLTGNFDMAEQLIRELLQRRESKIDQAAIYRLKIQLHELKGEYPQAVACGLECLNLFGIDIPAHPTQEQLQTEYEAVWQALNGRSIESLMDLPLMTDPEVQAATPVLRPEQIPASPISTIRTLVGHLDVETVVKASQALSSEIVLARLIHRKSR